MRDRGGGEGGGEGEEEGRGGERECVTDRGRKRLRQRGGGGGGKEGVEERAGAGRSRCKRGHAVMVKRLRYPSRELQTAVHTPDRLVGLVVKASASRAEDPRFESRLRRDFFGFKSYQ